MRPLHAALVFVAIALVALGAWWLVGSGESPPLETAPPVAARALDPAGSPDAAELVGPGDAADRDGAGAAPASARTVEEPVAPPPAAAAAGAPEGPALRGRVLDADGTPVEGARVLAANRSGLVGLPLDADVMSRFSWVRRAETTTDADGRFALAGLESGGAALAVRAPGFVPLDRENLALPSDGELDVGELALAPSPVVVGRVVDATGAPVAGAEVFRLDPTPRRSVSFFGSGRAGVSVATTDAEGGFRVDQLEHGPWRLLVATDAHPDQVVTGRAEAGRGAEHLEVALEPGYEVHGRVIDAPADAGELVVRARPAAPRDTLREVAGVEGATAAESRRADVGPDGRFAVRGLRAGQDYELALHAASGGGLEPSRSGTVAVRPGDRGVELRYQLESALVFQVVDAKTREPVEEFDVRAGLRFPMPLTGDDGRRLREHPEGRVRFGNLRPRGDQDRAVLQLEATGYEPFEQSDIVLAAESEVDLGTIALRPVPLMKVVVRDARDGQPVEGARVELERQPEPGEGGAFGVRIEIEEEDGEIVRNSADSRRATTDAEGVAHVSTFENETCVLRVRRRGFADHESEPFYVGASGASEQVVDLLQGGSVLVRLVDAAGQPVPGKRIDHRAPGARGPVMAGLMGHGGGHVTDASGEVTFAHLVEGAHSFRMGDGDGGAMFFGDGEAEMNVVVRGPGGPGEEDTWSTVAVAEEGEHELVLVAPEELELYGRVRESGEPLAGARVELRRRDETQHQRIQAMMGGGGRRTDTDGDGHYSLEGIEPGEYELVVTHPDRRMPAEYEVDVYTDERFDVELSVAILEGRVTDQDGAPVVGARVWAERSAGEGEGRPRTVMRAVFVTADSSGGGDGVQVSTDPFGRTNDTRTDADGRYSLRGVQVGAPLVVRVEHESAQPARSDAVVVENDQVRGGVDLTLEPAGEVVVRFQQPDGSPARNLLVVARYDDEEAGLDPKTEFAGEEGWVRLRGLKPGTWRLEPRRLGFGPGGGGGEPEELPSRTIEVLQGENEDVVVPLP